MTKNDLCLGQFPRTQKLRVFGHEASGLIELFKRFVELFTLLELYAALKSLTRFLLLFLCRGTVDPAGNSIATGDQGRRGSIIGREKTQRHRARHQADQQSGDNAVHWTDSSVIIA